MIPGERSNEPTVLIVGAGMAGLMAAAALPEFAHRISLVDKGRSAGGRMATRRLAGGRADHGAQFFTVRSPEFGGWVERWRAADWIYPWGTGWSRGSLDANADDANGAAHDGHPRYAARDGMNALAKRLAAEVSAGGAVVHTGVRVRAISRTDRNWWACSDDGRVYQGRLLALTCPVPQALALLDEGGVTLEAGDLETLRAIRYAPCLCTLVAIEGEAALPEPGALQEATSEIGWIADNRRKGISQERTVLTLHATPETSRRLYAASDDEVIAVMLPALEPWLGAGASVAEAQVKRWRYALPEVVHPQRYLAAKELPPLLFGGDAFGGPRVEGAALSGLALAGQLRALLHAEGVEDR